MREKTQKREEKQKTSSRKNERTKYERDRGLRSQKELIKDAIDMLKTMENYDFHQIYSLIHNVSSKNLLMEIYKSDRERLRGERK